MYLQAAKQNLVKFLTLKALAAHPPLCYRFSMVSTSSKAGIKRRTNHFACKTKSSGINRFEPNVDAG